jgi:hypothetical protein
MGIDEKIKELFNIRYPRFEFDKRINNIKVIPAPWHGSHGNNGRNASYGLSYSIDNNYTTNTTISENIVETVIDMIVIRIKEDIKACPLIQLEGFHFDSRANQIYDVDIRISYNGKRAVVFLTDLHSGEKEVCNYFYKRKTYAAEWELQTDDDQINVAAFKKLRGEEINKSAKVEVVWVNVTYNSDRSAPTISPDKTKVFIPTSGVDNQHFQHSEIIFESNDMVVVLWDVGEIGRELDRRTYVFSLNKNGIIISTPTKDPQEYNPSVWLDNVRCDLDTERNPFNELVYHLLEYAPCKYRSDNLFITYTERVYIRHNEFWIHLSEDSRYYWKNMMNQQSWLEWIAYNNIKELS